MSSPCMVYADEDGNILDFPELNMAASSGGEWLPVAETQCIPLPEGSELFLLPGRLPVGIDDKGEFTVLEEDQFDPRRRKLSAVAAFMAPAHTATLTAAYKTQEGAPALPLFAYTAVGFHRGRFVVTGLRTDPLPRQDAKSFPPRARLESQARRMLRKFPDNRLWQHLGTCALTYCCPAAQNLMLGRWEAGLPTSRTCNASCLGCISYQPEGLFPCTQERISFTPTPEEVAGVAVYHLGRGRDPLVSFGQGCEGEPLTEAELLEESIKLIRKKSRTGTINLNTNGSRPDVVRRLMLAGLSSIRVSMNSIIPERHQAYYQPKGWTLDDAVESIKVVKKAGGHASINLLCLPGVTDREDEAQALVELVEKTGLDLIQWRNLNLDPEIYLKHLGLTQPGPRIGMAELIKMLKQRFPGLKHGYFNPKVR